MKDTMQRALTAIRREKLAKKSKATNFRTIAEREVDVDEAVRALKVRVSQFALKAVF